MSSTGLSLGLKAAGVEAALTAKLERTQTLKLNYELAEGRDYELWRIAEGDGYVCLEARPDRSA